MAQFKVHNLIIVDASGSMTSIYEQALAGINETLSTIREEAKKSDKIEQSVTVLSFASGGEPLQYAYRNTIAEQTSPLPPQRLHAPRNDCPIRRHRHIGHRP